MSTEHPHPNGPRARATCLQIDADRLTRLFEDATADRDAFGSQYACAALEELAAVAIARVAMLERASEIPVAPRPAQRPGRVRRLQPVADQRDEQRARAELYPTRRGITVLPGGGDGSAA